MTVPSLAPSCPSATIASTFLSSFAASALTAGITGRTSNGSRFPGKTIPGVDSVVNPTKPILTPWWKLSVLEADHSLGVWPSGVTTLALSSGKSASGISFSRRYVWPRSKLWFPIASRSIPIMFMIGGVGRSPKKFEIGGVAPPNESPPATSMMAECLSSPDRADSAS